MGLAEGRGLRREGVGAGIALCSLPAEEAGYARDVWLVLEESACARAKRKGGVKGVRSLHTHASASRAKAQKATERKERNRYLSLLVVESASGFCDDVTNR